MQTFLKEGQSCSPLAYLLGWVKTTTGSQATLNVILSAFHLTRYNIFSKYQSQDGNAQGQNRPNILDSKLIIDFDNFVQVWAPIKLLILEVNNHFPSMDNWIHYISHKHSILYILWPAVCKYFIAMMQFLDFSGQLFKNVSGLYSLVNTF